MLKANINERLCMCFLFVSLIAHPMYKYFEYILNFPRINMTLIYIVIFLTFLLTVIYYSNISLKELPSSSFFLLIMISLIQFSSFPWAIDYAHDGITVYLKVISRTIFHYWLFWFSGLYIYKIWEKNSFWKMMMSFWVITVILILINALSNKEVFAIILNGDPIYLLLADSFSVLSIFILCKTKNFKKQFIIIIITSICLFALFSRTSLYCFIIVSGFFIYKKNKIVFLIIISLAALLLFTNISGEIVESRMLRIIFGSFDLSQSLREDRLQDGLSQLSNNWLLGNFMGDIEQNFGRTGYYIHNYLSFWRQFGLIPFLLLIGVVLPNSIRIFIHWFFSKELNGLALFWFLYTLFVLLEITLARSCLGSSYIWMSISGLYIFFKNFNNKTS